MGTLRGLMERLRCLLRNRTVERDLDEEIAFHLERETARNRARGMSEPEARFAARQDFGQMDRVKEAHRDARGSRLLLDFARDLRLGARVFVKSPALAAVAVLALGLGVGGNTATFSVLDAVLLEPLPLPEADRLVVVWQVREERGDRMKTAAWDVPYWEENARSFDGLAGVLAPTQVALLEGPQPEQVTAGSATLGYFDMLRVSAAIGRTFTDDERDRDTDSVVLTHGFWSRRFGADPGIVGRTLTINGQPRVVIGVLPREFRLDFPAQVDLWMPRIYTESELAMRTLWSEYVIARLAPGVTPEQAASEVMALAERAYEADDRQFRAQAINPVPLHEEVVGATRPALMMLLGAVVVVLLIACANVANLLLARNVQRRDELALRAALGAGRGRLTRQLLAESLVLSAAGAAAAVVIGNLLLRFMVRMAPADLPRLAEVGFDLRVGLFTAAAALGATLLFGVLPALRGARDSRPTRIVSSGRGSGSGSGERTFGALVAAESALVVLLVFSAGAMIQRYSELSATDTGFRTDNRIAAAVQLPSSRYDTPEAISGFFQDVTDRLRRVPGVEAAGGAWTLPLSGRAVTVGVPPVEGEPPRSEPLATGWDAVTPGFFEALDIPLVEGRLFTAADDRSAPHALIVNQTLARQLFGDGSAVGRKFAIGGNPPSMVMQIVGVVGDTVHTGLDDPPRNQIYQAQAQATFAYQRFEIVLATGISDPLSLAGEIRRAVAAVDPQQPVGDIRSLEQVALDSVRSERFLLVLLGTFGLVALLLGAIGIYGVVSYAVTRRQREMGLRLALGATRTDLRRLVLRHALLPVAIGLIVGSGAALAAARAIGSLISDVQPAHGALLAPVATLVLATALVAVWMPMRRALRADPLESLRAE